MDRRKILVVDDDPKTLELIEAMLVRAGYFVTTLSDSTRVADIMRKMNPDIILLDIMMPFEDGYTVLKKLKKGADRYNIPIIMVTALGDDDHKTIASVDGASAYITKPINKDVLLKTISSFLPDSTF